MLFPDGLPPIDGDRGFAAGGAAPKPGKHAQIDARSQYAPVLSLALMLTQVGTGFALCVTWISQQRRQHVEEEMEREGRALRLAHMRAALLAAAAENKIAHAA
jgi:hypothetical protein